ncbi:MAG: sugar ABC transporter permease, partial [Schaedlerella arabinosiphila]|nr:sugar ABC transporter permease [Schaedlerella arabinosiphila]
MAVFILIPIVFVFRMSLSDVSKAGIIKGFSGFANFTKVMHSSAFKLVLKNTIVWTVAVVVLSTLLGFILALILNNEFRGRKIARAIIVFPWATTLVIQASAWKFIIDTDYGTLNTLLLRLGIIEQSINWTPTAEAYFTWEIACGIFVTIPFVTFCVLSGLQSIDSTYYEAATVDGANYWQKLFQITMPLVRSSLTVSTVLNIIYVFNSFPIIWTIT